MVDIKLGPRTALYIAAFALFRCELASAQTAEADPRIIQRNVTLSSQSLYARQSRQPDLLSVAAAKLKKLAVDVQPGASSRGLNRIPYQVRSPDRKRTARAEKVSTLRESQLFRIVISGPGRRRAVIAEDVTNYFGLTWSPDGSKVAFSEGALLHIVDGDGRTRQLIYQGPGGPYPGACFDLSWSNGGRTLSFTQVENAQQLDLSRPRRVVITLGREPARD